MSEKDQRRLIILAVFLFFLFSLLIIQFYTIQIREGEKWSKRANRQHFLAVKEPFKRGRFISNTSNMIGHTETETAYVVDIPKYHLHIDPKSIPKEHRGYLAQELLKKLNLSIAEQMGFRGQFERKSRNRRLAMWLDREMRNTIQSWWSRYASKHKLPRNALFFVDDYMRSYPFGKSLGQVLHTIQNRKDENTQQGIPTGGVELYFNKWVAGKQGKRKLMRSPRNAFETSEVVTPPVHGADVYLTINHFLQAIAEEEVKKGVERCNAKAGWAIMMEPKTGEILALAQYPFYHPAEYMEYFRNPKLIDHTRVKAINDAYEPGSIMKPITLAVALKANADLVAQGQKPMFDPEAKTETSNPYFPGRSKELKDVRLHKFMNMNMALQKSSNIYMARLYQKVIERLGANWCRAAIQDMFGFGERTGVELPAETAGIMPTPGKQHPNGTLEWSAGTPYTLAMGHNIQASSLQILRAYATIANGGILVKPTLVRKILRTGNDGKQEVLADYTQKYKEFPRVMDEQIADRVVEAMKYVTKPGGTGRTADIWGYTEAGKSGTANKLDQGTYSQEKYISSFVGFSPAKNPAFVLIVTMDEPEYGYVPGVGKRHHGGTCAGPVFQSIATRSLELLGVTKDDPFGYPSQDPRYDASKADWKHEIEQLKEKYETWNK
jgi:cell division protein FtsI (penicillin-binding protein 3)